MRADELEAVRLVDREGLYQEAAAERMRISRPTFARILARARAAVAECLLDGKVLLIDGSEREEVVALPPTCPVHGGPRRRGRQCHCPRRGVGVGSPARPALADPDQIRDSEKGTRRNR
jgi:hypothetical protein